MKESEDAILERERAEREMQIRRARAERAKREMKETIDAIIGRMLLERAVNVSDSEIERTLRNCVCGPALIKQAKHYRDQGLITDADIHATNNE
jgi:hypothetical protein